MTIDTKTLRTLAKIACVRTIFDDEAGVITQAADTIDHLTHRLEITDDASGWDGIACRDETIRQQDNVIEAQRAEIARLREALTSVIGEVDDLIGESSGVYGLHLNGDPSPWGEVVAGGRFERLGALEEARAALAQEQS